jgi:hypothetical protein
MSQTYPCPNCGDYLDVPEEMARRPVRCATCQKVFTPAGGGLSEDDVDDRSARRNRYDDDPPRRKRRVWPWVFGILGLALFCCCGTVLYMAQQFLNPDWQAFESQAQGFTAEFPAEVEEQVKLTGRADGEKAPVFRAVRTIIVDEEYTIRCIPLTAKDRNRKPDTLLNELADAEISLHAVGRQMKPRVRRTYDGHEAMEFAVKMKAGTHLQARIVLAEKKAYILTVNGPGAPDQSSWVDKFFDNFKVVDEVKKDGK